jgi:dTDP-4-dehydrorhamnose reductase
MNQKKLNLLLIGASGFIGSFIAKKISDKNFILQAPDKNEFNILNLNSFQKYLRSNKVDCIINASGYADVFLAEKERNNKKGLVYQLNSFAPENLAKMANQLGIYLIHISTDAVFSDAESHHGPYSEKQIPSKPLSHLSWYAYTKLMGEELVIKYSPTAAIVRISYPFGYPHHAKDYLDKTIQNIKTEKGLFDDFYFTPTYLSDLVPVLEKLCLFRKKGVYHVATHPLVTPFQIGQYLNKKLSLVKTVKSTPIREFLNLPGQPKRNIYGGLDTKLTQKTLAVTFHDWKTATDEFLQSP